jgi:hypothetical protein
LENNTQNQDPYVGLYADALGRGVQIAQPVAAPNQAQMNMQSQRPQGGLNQGLVNASPSFLGGPNGAVAQGGQEEVQTENYLQALFNGETLTESFKEKAKLIFETAVNSKVALIEQTLLDSSYEVIVEEITQGVNVGIETGMVQLTEAVDGYLTYVGQTWLQENKLEVESGLRTEIAENFINGLKDLFENSFIEVPEEKVDIVDDLFEEKEKLENTLNEAISENMKLRSTLSKQLCIEQFVNRSRDLTDTEVEKLASLVENINFETIEEYGEKIQLLKESYFGKGSTLNTSTQRTPRFDTETPSNQSNTTASPLMESYVNAISRQLKLTNIKK